MPAPTNSDAETTLSRAVVVSDACSACDGCQWQDRGENGNYCYMFETPPIMLPCTQHDKFKDARDMIASIVRDRPEILALMAMGYEEGSSRMDALGICPDCFEAFLECSCPQNAEVSHGANNQKS